MAEFWEREEVKRMIEAIAQKGKNQFWQEKFAGSCYSIIVEYGAIVALAVEKSAEGVIEFVKLGFIEKNQRIYSEVDFPKHELVRLILDNEDFPFLTPNPLGEPPLIRIVDKAYLRTDSNNVLVDNLDNMPSFSEWRASHAREFLVQNLNTAGFSAK